MAAEPRAHSDDLHRLLATVKAHVLQGTEEIIVQRTRTGGYRVLILVSVPTDGTTCFDMPPQGERSFTEGSHD